MNRLLFLFLLIPTPAFAQKYSVERPDEMLEPDPYTRSYFEDKNDYRKVESVITITKNKYDQFRPDTLNITHYNDAGLPIKSTRYDYNRQSATTLLKYDAQQHLLSWQSFEQQQSILTRYFYDKANQLQETRQLRIKTVNQKNDSTELSRMLFQYDHSSLVEITNLHPGNKLTEQYIYDHKKLVRKTGGYIAKAFEYDGNGNVNSVKEYMGTDIVPEKLMGIKKFTYQANKLMADSVLTSSNLQSKHYQVSQYSYHANGVLEQMRVTYGNTYRNVSFTYNNNRIKEVNLETNEGNNAYLRFWINHRIADSYTFPIRYQEVFSYDAYGNRTAKKVFVNKELFSETEYKINYRK